MPQKTDKPIRKKSQPVITDEIFDAIALPIIIIDKDLQIIEKLNQKTRSEFGDSVQLNDFIEQFKTPKEGQFRSHLQKAFESGKEKHLTFSFKKKDWKAKFYPFSTGVSVLFEKQEIPIEQEKHLINQLILDSSGDYYVLTDKDLNVVDLNPKYLKTLNIAKSELKNYKATDFSEEMTKEKMSVFQKQAEKGPLLFDTSKQSRNGKIYDFEVNYFMVERNGKKFYASFARDVTAFKDAQRDLEKSNKRFELIAEATQEALWELNITTGERWANNIHQKLYGLTTKDPVPASNDWESSIDPFVRSKVVSGLNKAMKNKDSKWVAEYWFKPHTGKEVYIYDRTLMSYGKDGKLEKMMGSMVDITALKTAQEELNNQMSLSEGIINSLPGVFYLLSKDGKFLRWNKNFETITGFNHKEISSMRAQDFFYNRESGGLESKISEVFQKGWAEMEGNIIDKNGSGRPFYLSGWRTIIGNEECLIGTGIDMSEIKKAQESLKRMELKITEQKIQEQKTISRAIINAQEKERNYIGRELHDNVNQLLAGARLYLTMGAKKDVNFGEMIKYPLELLDNGIQEIRHLTHRNITPSKDVELKQLIEGISDILKAGTIQCSLHYDLERTLNENLMINVYRILQEQANNIIKHAKAEKVTIRVEDRDSYLYIQTVDDGIGFDVHHLREGIGLYNIYSRVEAYNGEVVIESEPGMGCKIEIKLPLSQSLCENSVESENETADSEASGYKN